jgi:hypothetical protein
MGRVLSEETVKQYLDQSHLPVGPIDQTKEIKWGYEVSATPANIAVVKQSGIPAVHLFTLPLDH